MKTITLYGAPVSPYVRKTRLALAFKEIEYQNVPVLPRSAKQPEIFVQHSPLRKIPLLQVGDEFIADSTAICLSLDKIKPAPPLLPEDLTGYGRAIWFEEYADGPMSTAIASHLFAEVVLAKIFFKREPIQADIDKAIQEELPFIFDLLDRELKGDFLVGDTLTLGDIAVCGLFVAMHHCGVRCDEDKWPKLAHYIKRVHDLPFFNKVIEQEQQLLRQMGVTV